MGTVCGLLTLVLIILYLQHEANKAKKIISALKEMKILKKCWNKLMLLKEMEDFPMSLLQFFQSFVWPWS